MSIFDNPPRPAAAPAPKASGRSRALMITIGILLVLIIVVSLFSQFWTEKLWYSSVERGDVFSTMVWMRIGLFVVFGLVMALAVGVNLYLGHRFRPLLVPSSANLDGMDRYRQAVGPIKGWMLGAISGVMGLFAGVSAAGQWRTFALWRNQVPFGTKDDFFDKDVSWYVFSLPWWHYVVDFVMAAAVIGLMAAAVVHYLYGGIRLQAKQNRLTGAAQVQFSVLLGIFVLAKAVDFWLDRFDLMGNDGSVVDGMSYTGEHALLPAKNILMFISLMCAVLFFLNVWRRTWLLPSVGVALLVLSSILMGALWPGVVQKFQVDPSVADKEAPYIAKNILATRQAYGIADTNVTSYATDATSSANSAGIQSATSSVPLLDPKVMSPTFEQQQQVRDYYTVNGVLDVDRYEVDGQERAMVLGVRELDQTGIPDSAKNWINLHTVYTHGDGLIAAYGNQRPADDAAQANDIQWAEGNEPGEDALSGGSDKYQGKVYFGELSPGYSIVGKKKDGNAVELALPTGERGTSNDTTSYEGSGGVGIGGLFRKLLYAVKFSEPKIVLSDRVHEDSKILYHRNPRTMVEKVAPWLTVDNDPYPAIVDGRITWILDGYTVTDKYPQSEKGSMREMTDDALTQEPTFATLPTDDVNYMRNSVKATVDAYDGTVTLYEWDETDPMLKAWKGVFPGVVQDKSEISEALMEHLRYPEDLFKVQRFQLARYHVTDAKDMFEENNRWEVPEDPNTPGRLQPPYRLFVNPTGERDDSAPEVGVSPDQVWSLTSVFVPKGRNQLAAFVSVNSDATSADYGKIEALQMPNQRTDGPKNVANKITSDPAVSAALLRYKQAEIKTTWGNLLSMPVGEGMMFVQPLYTSGSGEGSFPLLRNVMVYYNGKVGLGTANASDTATGTLVAAIADVLGVEAPTTPPTTTPPTTPATPGSPTPSPTPGGVNAQIRDLLGQAQTKFDEADEFQKQGETVKWARATEQARKLIAQAVALADGR